MKARITAAVAAVSAAGLIALAQHEGEVRKVYLDPVGIPTVCVGHTGSVTRADVGKAVSAETCQTLLRQDVRHAEQAVKRCTTAPLTQQQYDQFVSLTFNIGGTAFCQSTLIKKHNIGDCQGAASQFLRWKYARGVELPGLRVRRQHESDAYRADCP